MDRQEALKIVRENYPHFGTTEPWLELEKALATLIPELRESEDERIRKWLVDYFSSIKKTVWIHRDITCEQILDWLEKQKEQKPAEWSEEDADMLNCCISSIEESKENRYAYKETDGDTSYDHEIAWLKSLRPSWKPREEDLMMLEHIIEQYETGNKNSKIMGYLPRVEELDFLKKVFAIWKN